MKIVALVIAGGALALAYPIVKEMATAPEAFVAEVGASADTLDRIYYSGPPKPFTKAVEAAKTVDFSPTAAALYERNRIAAEAGDANAQARLGSNYYLGVGVAVDHEKSFLWTQRAAEQGHVKAKHGVIYALWDGVGVERDRVQAEAMARALADTGDVEAMNRVGRMITERKGSDEEFHAAWEKAANAGDPQGHHVMAAIYLNGVGVKEDIARGLAWLERLANTGDAETQRMLGEMYLDGNFGVRRNTDAGLRWIEMAAANGEPSAQAIWARRGEYK